MTYHSSLRATKMNVEAMERKERWRSELDFGFCLFACVLVGSFVLINIRLCNYFIISF